MASLLCARACCRTCSASSHHRRPRQSEMPEHIDQFRQALFAVSVDIELGIVEETYARAQPDPAIAHVVRDHVGRPVTIAPECAFQITAGVIENVTAAPINELQEP